MADVFIPPGGFAGYSQQTVAAQRATAPPAAARRAARRTKRSATSKARKSKRTKRAGKLKFGSPAWRKKYMKRKK